MDTSGLFSPQEAKKRVQTEINEILQCLENKKDEMFTEIETIEKEYLSKQQQKQKKINKINALIEQTEELADNSLTNVQNRIIEDLQNELSKASIQESDCSVEFQWGFSRDIISIINNIEVRRVDTRTRVLECRPDRDSVNSNREWYGGRDRESGTDRDSVNSNRAGYGGRLIRIGQGMEDEIEREELTETAIITN
eukprot:TRINITY_DN2084_c0_g1_i20.p1 TRINITY_DN2084_c0_g1~~TRINITY_DN2084_c0_g1_i20.p1  ORF type:complete len:196 (-),score=52.60 TRINITY_DN2084_c0_g1_i20:168-755(-)